MDENIKADQKPDITETKEIFNPDAFGASLKQDVLAEIEGKFPELTESLSAKVKQDIIKSISGEEKKGPWVPKTYEEIVEKATAEMEKKLEERGKKAQEQQSKYQEDMNKTQEEWNKYWDNQLNDMEKEGLVPKIPDEIVEKLANQKPLTDQERKHPAIQARVDLYTKSKELKDEGYRDWFNMELVYYKHMKPAGRMSGREAPVQTRSVGAVSKTDGDYSYNYIRSRSTAQILRDSMQGK